MRFDLSFSRTIYFLFFIFYFYLYIYPPDSQEGAGSAIHRASNYPDLLPEMPRYCYSLEILIEISLYFRTACQDHQARKSAIFLTSSFPRTEWRPVIAELFLRSSFVFDFSYFLFKQKEKN